MKKFMLCALLATMFAACTKDAVQDVSTLPTTLPEIIHAGIKADEARVHLNIEQKTVWTKGDQFFMIDTQGNAFIYGYTGNGGESVGEFKMAGQAGQTSLRYNRPFAFYAESLSVATASGIPAGIMQITPEQNYAPNSYDPTFVNQMVAVESDTPMVFSFKNVLGYLKVSLTGNKAVKSIRFTNQAYPLSGTYYVTIENPASFTWYKDLYGYLNLNCGDGVQLSGTPTDFYFVMGPGKYPEGITMTVTFTDDTTWSKTNTTGFTIERNTIQPLSVINVSGDDDPTPPTPTPGDANVTATYTTPEAFMPQFTGDGSVNGTIYFDDGYSAEINSYIHYIFADTKPTHNVAFEADGATQAEFKSCYGLTKVDFSNF